MNTFLLMNFPPLTGIVCILIFLYTNPSLDGRITKLFKSTSYLAIVELAAYSLELWTATWAYPSVLRIFLSVIGYTIRPLMLYLIVVLIMRNRMSRRLRLYMLLPTIVVMLVSSTAFFSDIAFSYTADNQFVRGPLGYLYFVAVSFYFLVALFFSTRFFQKNWNQEGVINLAIIVMNVIAIGAEALWAIRGLGGTSMVYSIIFYYMYFQAQSAKKEATEKAEIANRNLQEKNTIIGALSTEYSSVFIIDWETSEIQLYNLLDSEYAFASKMVSDCRYYDEAVDAYVHGAVSKEDREELQTKMRFKKVKEELVKQGIYYVSFHRVLRGINDHAQFVYSLVAREDGGKNIVLAVRSVNDIVEWERQRKALLEENLRYMEVVNALASEFSSVIYYEQGMEHVIPYRLLEANEDYVRMLEKGITFDELFGSYISMVKFDEDRKALEPFKTAESTFKQLEENDGHCVRNFRVERKGKIYYYQAKVVRTGNEKDGYGAVVGFANKDAEIRREMEYQKTLEKALDKAEIANKAKSAFLFNMSHDIRTPMHAILGFTDIARKHMHNPERVADALNKVQMSGNHLLALIDQILDMARVENNKITLNEQPVSIREMVSKLADMLRIDVDKKHQAFTVEFRDLEQDLVYLDELRCNQISLNILSNAVKYTPEGGHICLRIVQDGECSPGIGDYKFIYEDDGVGMSADLLSKVYQPFARERGVDYGGIQGTGLGMAIVKGLVDLMNGRITIESTPGVGTRVSVRVPLRYCNEVLRIEQEKEPETEFQFCGIRLLLADDNDLNREIAREILMSEGIIVEEAADGEQAVEMVWASAEKQEEPDKSYYDLILMDVQMPRMDGYKASRVIRAFKNPVLANIPIIAFTVNAFEEDIKRALESGMNTHVAKPVDLPRLKKAIRKCLEEKE